MLLQYIVVALILAVCVAAIVRRIWRLFHRSHTHDSCSSGSDASASCDRCAEPSVACPGCPLAGHCYHHSAE